MIGSFKRRRAGTEDQAAVVWDSSPRVDRDRLINRLVAIGIGTTSVSFEHACYCLGLLGAVKRP